MNRNVTETNILTAWVVDLGFLHGVNIWKWLGNCDRAELAGLAERERTMDNMIFSDFYLSLAARLPTDQMLVRSTFTNKTAMDLYRKIRDRELPPEPDKPLTA